MQAEQKWVSLKDIVPDPNQPRKHFDEEKLAELSRSISSQGVLQPILIRPLKTKNKGKYMLVTGERRYRASLNAMLEDIPCMIQILTDGEALDRQITENLQREDVNPMEEADALQAILKGGMYKPKELAARLGKRIEYVLQRIKLCDLIPGFQDLVYADKLLLSQANNICKFSADVQQSFFESYVPKDWKEKPVGWKLREVHFGNTTHNLDAAPFETEDPKLNPKMGACNNCRFNSFVSQLPFEGQENKRICSNPGCYEIKVKNAFHQKVKEVAEDDDILFVAGYAYGEEAKKKIEAAEATGKLVLKDSQFKILRAPEPPKPLPTFEDYKVSNEWQDDATEEGMHEDYKQELETYEEELVQYQEELKGYEDKKQFAKKAYMVSGYQNEGQMVEVYVPGLADGGVVDVGIQEKVAELRRKNDTSEENAKQKLYKDLETALLSSPRFADKEDLLELTEQEMLFAVLVRDAGYATVDEIKQDWGKKVMTDVQLLQDVIATGRTSFMYKWIRRLLLKAMGSANFEYQRESFKTATMVINRLADRFIPHEKAGLIAEKKNKQQAREEKMNEKIVALQQTQIPTEA